jgi:hypothetical protein
LCEIKKGTKMSNRTKIQSFCKRNNIELVSCDLNRYSAVVPECLVPVTEYHVSIMVDGELLQYESGECGGDTTSEDVDIMLENIKEDIDYIRTNDDQNIKQHTTVKG